MDTLEDDYQYVLFNMDQVLHLAWKVKLYTVILHKHVHKEHARVPMMCSALSGQQDDSGGVTTNHSGSLVALLSVNKTTG
jgi:hypothetical protein